MTPPAGWLPPGREPGGPALPPWQPPSLAGVAVEELLYVVVDELEGPSVGLAVSWWPRVDESGRVRFPDGAWMLGADRQTFERFLAGHRRPRELADRPLRIGDVFAVRAIRDALDRLREELEEQRRLEPFLDPADWLRPPVYDITSDAREAAKASFYAAVTPTLGPREADWIRDIAEPRPPPVQLHPGLLRRVRDLVGAHVLAVGAGAALLAAGMASGTAVGYASAPTRLVARTTITVSKPGRTLTETVTQEGATVTSPGPTVTKTRATTKTTTVTEAGATVTKAGATVTEPGQTTTLTVTSTETVTLPTTVVEQTTTTIAVPYTLGVQIDGREGSVISRPPGISCRKVWDGKQSVSSGRCSRRFPAKTAVSLVARPIRGENSLNLDFDGWGVAGCIGKKTVCRAVSDDSVTISASFVSPIG
jgi:hypothetical protein